MANSAIAIRGLGINSKQELEPYIQKSSDERQKVLNGIREIESKMDKLSEIMEQVENIMKHREHYKYHKANPDDENFSREYSTKFKLYTVASKSIMETYNTVPKSKDILAQLDKLQKRNTLMQEYSKSNNLFYELVQYKKNYENYMDKEVEK